MKKNILICLDRDGTLNYDKKYHLGKDKNWKSKIRLMPQVTSGLKLLKKLPNTHFYIITNQPGISRKDMPLLTEAKAKQVCQYIKNKINSRVPIIKDCFICEHPTKGYARKYGGEKNFIKKNICNCQCLKPKPGMINQALRKAKLKKSNTNIYVIGDRATDVQAAINAKGFGILIPFKNEPGQTPEFKKIKNKNKKKAKNFLEAAKIIYKKETTSGS